MATCGECIHLADCIIEKRTRYLNYNLDIACNNVEELCKFFKSKANYVEVVRCKDCKHAIPLDKHCELNSIYKHCSLLHGEPEDYVWHKYKKYFKNYSIVEDDDFCSYGELKEGVQV